MEQPRTPQQRLERQIDTVLDEMLQLTEEQRRVFVERFASAARRAGISADQAAATLRDLGRMVANRK